MSATINFAALIGRLDKKTTLDEKEKEKDLADKAEESKERKKE